MELLRLLRVHCTLHIFKGSYGDNSYTSISIEKPFFTCTIHTLSYEMKVIIDGITLTHGQMLPGLLTVDENTDSKLQQHLFYRLRLLCIEA